MYKFALRYQIIKEHFLKFLLRSVYAYIFVKLLLRKHPIFQVVADTLLTFIATTASVIAITIANFFINIFIIYYLIDINYLLHIPL